MKKFSDWRLRNKLIFIISLLVVIPLIFFSFLATSEFSSALKAGEETSWEMYRRKLKMLNRNKLIVFIASYFGIFLSHEVIMLVDVPVHKTAQELGVTRTSIYTKYTGLSPP